MKTLVEAIAITQHEVTMYNNKQAKILLGELSSMYRAVGDKSISFVHNQLTNEEYATLVLCRNNLYNQGA